MLRSSLLILLALTSWNCGPPDDAPGAPVWRGTFKGKDVTLFGTVHTLSLDTARQTFPGAIGRFDGRGTLYVESDATSPEALMTIAQFSTRLSRDPGLDTELTADEWKTLVEATKPFISEANLKRTKPWFASALYSGAVAPTVDEAGKPITGMDQAMVDEARKAGVEVRFLETTLAAVLAASDAISAADLKTTLASGPDGQKKARADLEKAWRAGDMKTLAAAANGLPMASRDALLNTRNTNWGVNLPKQLPDVASPVFVAVGTAHLVAGGSQSFPEVLRLFDVPVMRETR